MDSYFIIFNDKTNLDFNVRIPRRVPKPSAIMNYEEKPISGGRTLYVEKGYGDIEISIEFNFKSKNSWDVDFREVKKWLLNFKNDKLMFSDDLEVFYKVKKVIINNPERVLKRIGKFIVTFVCDPYVYLVNGDSEFELGNYLYNEYLESRPIYRIVGEGPLTLTINEKVIKVNVGQEVIINTELGLVYRDGEINNIAMTGMYEDLYIKEKDNNFKWSGNFKIYVTPNWRCL